MCIRDRYCSSACGNCEFNMCTDFSNIVYDEGEIEIEDLTSESFQEIGEEIDF